MTVQELIDELKRLIEQDQDNKDLPVYYCGGIYSDQPISNIEICKSKRYYPKRILISND